VVACIFANEDEAARAVDALLQEHFDPEHDLSVTVSHRREHQTVPVRQMLGVGHGGEIGAAVGAVLAAVGVTHHRSVGTSRGEVDDVQPGSGRGTSVAEPPNAHPRSGNRSHGTRGSARCASAAGRAGSRVTCRGHVKFDERLLGGVAAVDGLSFTFDVSGQGDERKWPNGES
jgi:hypothetical protein